MLPTAWGVGVVVAPLAGGLLAKPADIFPGLRGTLLDRFPYLLPCLIGVVLQCCAIVFVLCVMQEPRRARQGFVRLDRQRGVAQAQGQAQGQAGVGEAPTPGSEEEQEGGVQMVRLVPEAAPAGAGTDLESGAAVESGSSMTAITNISSKPRASVRAVLCRRVVALSIGNYAMLALAYMVIDELLPLWFAAASIDFGLEFNSSEIGIFMVVRRKLFVCLVWHQSLTSVCCCLPPPDSRRQSVCVYTLCVSLALSPHHAAANAQVVGPHVCAHVPLGPRHPLAAWWPGLDLVADAGHCGMPQDDARLCSLYCCHGKQRPWLPKYNTQTVVSRLSFSLALSPSGHGEQLGAPATRRCSEWSWSSCRCPVTSHWPCWWWRSLFSWRTPSVPWPQLCGLCFGCHHVCRCWPVCVHAASVARAIAWAGR